jgi:hypothetical protein
MAYASADRREEPEGRPGKATRPRDLLTSPRTEFLMEAHDGLSAKIVEEAGFEGICASGLAMSAALGVSDSNEAMEGGGTPRKASLCDLFNLATAGKFL